MQYDVVILGGGPAGLTAGLYAGRAQLKTRMIEKLMPGGQVAVTDWIENYPGFEEGIAGMDLVQRIEKQAKRFGLEITSGVAENLDINANPKTMTIGGETISAKTIIIATGSHPKLLNVPGEEQFKGRGVSYCATCDGPFFKDKDVVVVGGGSSGVQESLYLSRFVNSIQLVEIMDQLNAEKILQERAHADPKFSFYLGHKVLSIEGDERVTGVKIQDKSGKETALKADGVFIWIGFVPNTDFLVDRITLNKWGYIETDEHMRTSVPGVFAAGDVRSKEVRQITTAVGDGTIASEMALKYIEEL
jgi:thioredoxin reductase (NADPH)